FDYGSVLGNLWNYFINGIICTGCGNALVTQQSLFYSFPTKLFKSIFKVNIILCSCNNSNLHVNKFCLWDYNYKWVSRVTDKSNNMLRSAKFVFSSGIS